MEVTVDKPVPTTNTQDSATAGMTTVTVNESDGKTAGAGTYVDCPEELCQDIQDSYVSIGNKYNCVIWKIILLPKLWFQHYTLNTNFLVFF